MNALAALWISIALGAFAQIVLKLAVSGPLGGTSTRAVGWWMNLLRSGWLWAYALSFAVATGLWMLALSGLNISYAFPLLSASYVLVAVLARLCLKESVSVRRWIAIAVICLGVILIARS
jgi:drug/metabolite transporter (DMT)-like permease